MRLQESASAGWESREAVRVTMLMAPENAWLPNTREAAPSRISMRSMSEMLMGKSEALCPVWGLLSGTPLRRIAIWSNVPPLILRSVCMPKAPRCLTSTPVASLRMSPMQVMPAAAAKSSRVSVTTCRAATSAAKGARVPDTTASASSRPSCPAAARSESLGASMPTVVAPMQGAAVASVAALSTPMRTSRPKQAKSDQPLRENCVKVRLLRSFLMVLKYIKIK